jgi:hypothetical protein
VIERVEQRIHFRRIQKRLSRREKDAGDFEAKGRCRRVFSSDFGTVFTEDSFCCVGVKELLISSERDDGERLL